MPEHDDLIDVIRQIHGWLVMGYPKRAESIALATLDKHTPNGQPPKVGAPS